MPGRADHAGQRRSLLRPVLDARHVHGASGLAGARLPEPASQAEDGHAVDYLIETISAAPAR